MALPADFKAALGSWSTGVAVVTVHDEGQLYGLTVSSFTSVSFDPPIVLVCVARENRLPAMAARGGKFAVSVLRADQEPASRYFALPGRLPSDGFTVIDGLWTEHGVPVLQGALAWVVCEHRRSVQEGDHDILLGRVLGAWSDPTGTPLLYWRRGYRALVVDR